MKKMVWQHNGAKEIVFVLGFAWNNNALLNNARAFVLDVNQVFHDIPANELQLTVEDYNKTFAV